MSDFTLESDAIALPRGAWAKAHRMRLRHRGRTLLALTQGAYRAYAFPLMTPAGFCVAAEGPADHPHHSGVWIASDHVHTLMPGTRGTVEEYTYNFYVDETFQGRAPGRILSTALDGRAVDGERFEIVQQLEWRGPDEWAARGGRLIAREVRTLAVTVAGPDRSSHRIDVTSRLAGGDLALKLGPTRHAYFNLRVADTMIAANGGLVQDDRGRSGGAEVSGAGARWVDFSGPVGGGAIGGISLIPRPSPGRELFWFVADWGVVTVGPFREQGLRLEPGREFESRYSLLVHDGPPDAEEIERVAKE